MSADLSFGDFRLVPRTGELWRGTEAVKLTPRAAAVLVLLARSAPQLVTKEDLIANVWDSKAVGDEALTSCIRELRRALGDDSHQPRYIETRHRRGYRLLASVVSRQSEAPPAPATDKPSIAVLAFANMSGDPDQAYFAEGIADDIITALSRLPQFRVVARNSSFAFKDRSVDVRQIGRELGVRYVVEGSVQRGASRLRVSAQLIDAVSGNHVWANRYEGAPQDIFDLQDRVTASIVAALEPAITQAEIARAQSRATQDLGAWDAYLRALALCFPKGDRESLGRALPLLDRAVEIDPGFSTAWGLITQIHFWYGLRGWVPLEESRVPGLQAARRAAETGINDPRALAWAGALIPRHGGTIEEGRHCIERALALAPNSLHVQRQAVMLFVSAGDHAAAIATGRRIIELDPLDHRIGNTHYFMAFSLFFLGRYAEALVLAEKSLLTMLEERPSIIRLLLALEASVAGRKEKLDALRNEFIALTPHASIANEMHKLSHLREPDRARMEAALRKAGLPE